MNENNKHSILNSVVVHAQYIKDMSFENPKAPQVFFSSSEASINVDIDLSAQSCPVPGMEQLFEVVFKVIVHTSVENESSFLLELHYAGLFALEIPLGSDIKDQEIERVLLVYGPHLLFPYVRQIVADATKNGGYSPVMLTPMDFESLYLSRRKS